MTENINVRILTQYIKDLSFKIHNAPKVFMNNNKKPDIALSFNLDAVKISQDGNGSNYEISLKIVADASCNKGEEKIFLIDLLYAGVFFIEGDIKEDVLEQLLLVYCPNLLFPFIRRIMSNTVSDGGFPALLIDPIDFAALYQRKKLTKDAEPVNETKN